MSTHDEKLKAAREWMKSRGIGWQNPAWAYTPALTKKPEPAPAPQPKQASKIRRIR